MHSYYSMYSQIGILATLRKCRWPAKAAGQVRQIPSMAGVSPLSGAQGTRVFAREDGDPSRSLLRTSVQFSNGRFVVTIGDLVTDLSHKAWNQVQNSLEYREYGIRTGSTVTSQVVSLKQLNYWTLGFDPLAFGAGAPNL